MESSGNLLEISQFKLQETINPIFYSKLQNIIDNINKGIENKRSYGISKVLFYKKEEIFQSTDQGELYPGLIEPSSLYTSS